MTKVCIFILFWEWMHYISTAGEPCHTKKLHIRSFLEETLKITMKNKFEGSSEIFKDNFKEM